MKQGRKVSFGGKLLGIYVQKYSTQDYDEIMYYVHTDRLGSYDVVTDADGNIVDSMSFDAWGNRRAYNNWTIADTAIHLFTRGYTGHEHLDKFGIINMNGRLYDPVIARFFSPDPFVQAPEFSQSFNRYSYCWNNPLMATDPSGEFVFAAILAPTGVLLPLGMILDAACWGALFDAFAQHAKMAFGMQQQFNWSEMWSAAAGAAVFAGIELLAPAFAIPSTTFKANLPVYAKKAAWATATAAASTFAGMYVYDKLEYDNPHYDGDDYLKGMFVGGLISGGLSFAASIVDYFTWDKLPFDEKIKKLKDKFNIRVEYKENLLNKPGEYFTGDDFVTVGPLAFRDKDYAYSTVRHERKHYRDWRKLAAGKLKMLEDPITRIDRYEIRAYKHEMRYHRTTLNTYRGIVDLLKRKHGYDGFGNFVPNPFMYLSVFF